MASEYAIETEGLGKTYHSRWTAREIHAVSNLTLRVPQGAKFGLLGANGAGKTTFVKMLLSAVIPTEGTANLFGRNAREPEARRPVGYLPENHRFPTYFTGEGMLDFYAALSGVESHQRRQRVPELLKLVGLENWGDVKIRKYSKGMLQRLGLAQALIHRPRLLILDEPTDGVDPVGRREIREILNGLTGSGVTVFINSHLLAEVESFCDYVAILNKGRLALEGRVSSLVSERGYSVSAVEVSETVAAALRRFGSIIQLNQVDRVEVRVTTRGEANEVIDVIRAGGGSIVSLTGASSSLEDVFIEATHTERAA